PSSSHSSLLCLAINLLCLDGLGVSIAQSQGHVYNGKHKISFYHMILIRPLMVLYKVLMLVRQLVNMFTLCLDLAILARKKLSELSMRVCNLSLFDMLITFLHKILHFLHLYGNIICTQGLLSCIKIYVLQKYKLHYSVSKGKKRIMQQIDQTHVEIPPFSADCEAGIMVDWELEIIGKIIFGKGFSQSQTGQQHHGT
ncbi:hypothetical protein ACJX0J_040725, partial [Zea mays]